MPSGWYPWAWAEGGPAGKVGAIGGVLHRTGKGAVIHSAEGSLQAALAVLNGPKLASWHFTVAKEGQVFQHYALDIVTWHAGAANGLYTGIECEGVAGETVGGPQLDALTNLLLWIGDQEDWEAYARGVTLFEHNEFMATACPSGRIPWDRLISRLEGEPAIWGPAPLPDVKPEPDPASSDPYPLPERAVKALVAAAFVISIGRPLSDLSAEDRVTVIDLAHHL